MNRLWPVLLPELRAFPASERDRALKSARGTALDTLELLVMAVGIVAAIGAARFLPPAILTADRPLSAGRSLLVGVPVLAACWLPLQRRRLRRGLRSLLAEQREAA